MAIQFGDIFEDFLMDFSSTPFFSGIHSFYYHYHFYEQLSFQTPLAHAL